MGMSNAQNPFIKIAMEAMFNAVANNANLTESPWMTLGKMLETKAPEIEAYFSAAAAKLKEGQSPVEVVSASKEEDVGDDGLTDYEREFVEAARAAINDPSKPDITDFASGLLTIVDMHHPKSKNVTLEGLLEKYKGGHIPADELQEVLSFQKKA